LGADSPQDPAGLLYYLNRVFLDTSRRKVAVVPSSPSSALLWEPARRPQLVVVSTETTPANARLLADYLQGGGTVLFVVTASGRAETLGALAQVPPWTIEEAQLARDVMLGEIAFEHPLFSPLAGAQFNDFTKIHFWKYRRLGAGALGGAHVLARF